CETRSCDRLHVDFEADLIDRTAHVVYGGVVVPHNNSPRAQNGQGIPGVLFYVVVMMVSIDENQIGWAHRGPMQSGRIGVDLPNARLVGRAAVLRGDLRRFHGVASSLGNMEGVASIPIGRQVDREDRRVWGTVGRKIKRGVALKGAYFHDSSSLN